MNAVVEAIPARMGGILTYTRELSRTLPRLLGRMTLVAPHGAVAVEPSASFAHVPAPKLEGIAAVLAGAPIVKRVLDAEMHPVLFASANFTLQRRAIPQLLLMRNPIYFDPPYREHVLRRLPLNERMGIELRRGLCLSSALVARHVITPTKAMRDLVIAARPDLAGRVEAVPYGVDASRFAAMAGSRKASEKGTLRVVCHSLLAMHKPVWPIVEGVRLARSGGANVTLTLLDPPTDTAHDGMPEVERDREAAQRGQSEGWLTITGRLPHDRVPALLASHDAFAFHTMSESFGHPYVEAMASGLASVLTDIPVARELAGDAASYVPLFSAESFAEAFTALANDPTKREELSQKGMKRVASMGLTWERHFSRVAELMRLLSAELPIRPVDAA